MRFNFNTWNHCEIGQLIIEDITRNLGEQLIALGHEVAWDNRAFIREADGYNVLLESFADDPETIPVIGEARRNGCRFIIVATEEPTPNGFNSGLEPAMIERQRVFPDAAAHASAILHLMPGRNVNSWYSQFAPAAYAELGFVPRPPVPDVEPTADFGFYGKMTWRREQVLGKLQKLGKVLVLDGLDTPRDRRDELMRGCKLIVQIRANEEWGMVSSTRCSTALALGRAVLAEPHHVSAPWDRVVTFAKSTQEFYELAVQIANGDWRKCYQRQNQTFARLLRPDRCIGHPLRETGIL